MFLLIREADSETVAVGPICLDEFTGFEFL